MNQTKQLRDADGFNLQYLTSAEDAGETSVLDDLERPEDEARHDEEQHQQHPLGWHKPGADGQKARRRL